MIEKILEKAEREGYLKRIKEYMTMRLSSSQVKMENEDVKTFVKGALDLRDRFV